MKITELRSQAYQNALAEERKAEWNGENVSEETLVDFSLMNGTEYDCNGHFIEYRQ